MPLPVSALLSHAYVACGIEIDNEAEHWMRQRTTRHSGAGGWLTSSTMWFNCLRFVPEAGISVEELLGEALTSTNFHGMARWGYITVDDRIVRLTPKGKYAKETWPQFLAIIDARWRKRFGNAAIGELRESLVAIAASFGRALPDVMPILGAGLRITGRVREAKWAPAAQRDLGNLPLLSLLAKPLIVIGTIFERDSDIALAIAANILRAIDGTARVRDLPVLSGVSKQAIAIALTALTKQRYASVLTKDRVRTVALTATGEAQRASCVKVLESVERRVANECGTAFDRLRAALAQILDPENTLASLRVGLEPYSDNWRAEIRRPQRLPNFPVPLHRGGYPDGS